MSIYKQAIRNSIFTWYESKELYETYLTKKFENYKYICIFGLGNIGIPTLKIFLEKNLRVDFLCDNDKFKWGKEYCGIKCVSPSELEKYKEETLVIICGRAFNEIYNQLKKDNFPYVERIDINKFYIYKYLLQQDMYYILNNLEQIIDLCYDEESKKVFTKIIEEWTRKEYKHGFLDDIYSGNQYFPKDIIGIQENEVFVDGGAYDGDTLRSYMENINDNFEKYYCFELSKKNCKRLKEYIFDLDENLRNKIVTINKGLSDREDNIWYLDSDEGSQIDILGNTEGIITTIDKDVNGKITFIKMDIEGSELAALKGAKQTIKKYKPKLAICLYHNPWDMWEIPIYIKEIVPEYKIYIRHHTHLLNETVCYAKE